MFNNEWEEVRKYEAETHHWSSFFVGGFVHKFKDYRVTPDLSSDLKKWSCKHALNSSHDTKPIHTYCTAFIYSCRQSVWPRSIMGMRYLFVDTWKASADELIVLTAALTGFVWMPSNPRSLQPCRLKRVIKRHVLTAMWTKTSQTPKMASV